VVLIGLCLASVRRKGGKGVYLAIGLGISFMYLTVMKLIEPLGINGVLTPLESALYPHVFFAIASVYLLLSTKK
jgi:lipopolysaccharide export system permease protein